MQVIRRKTTEILEETIMQYRMIGPKGCVLDKNRLPHIVTGRICGKLMTIEWGKIGATFGKHFSTLKLGGSFGPEWEQTLGRNSVRTVVDVICCTNTGEIKPATLSISPDGSLSITTDGGFPKDSAVRIRSGTMSMLAYSPSEENIGETIIQYQLQAPYACGLNTRRSPHMVTGRICGSIQTIEWDPIVVDVYAGSRNIVFKQSFGPEWKCTKELPIYQATARGTVNNNVVKFTLFIGKNGRLNIYQKDRDVFPTGARVYVESGSFTALA